MSRKPISGLRTKTKRGKPLSWRARAIAAEQMGRCLQDEMAAVQSAAATHRSAAVDAARSAAWEATHRLAIITRKFDTLLMSVVDAYCAGYSRRAPALLRSAILSVGVPEDALNRKVGKS